MPDRQFSTPFGMIDCFGGDEYLIDVKGKCVRFEWSEQFGPFPINKDGAEARGIGPKHGFWRAVSLWHLQGRRIDGNKAIWHEPPKPVYVAFPFQDGTELKTEVTE